MHIKTKLTGFLLVISQIPLLISMGLSLWYIRGQLEDLSIQTVKERLQMNTEHLSGYFLARLSEIEAYANSPLIESMDWVAMRPFLKSEVKRHNGIYEKFVVGLPNSNFYVTSGGNKYLYDIATFNDNDPTAKRKFLNHREYWLALVGENHPPESLSLISNPMISYTTGTKQIVVGTTIFSNNKNLVGMLGGTIPWQEIEARMNMLRDAIVAEFGEGVKISLVDSKGVYVYHWDPGKVIHLALNNKGQVILDDFGEKKVVVNRITEEKSSELAAAGQALINGENGYALFRYEETKSEMAVLFAPVETSGYGLLITLKSSVIMAPVLRMQHMFGKFFLITIIIIIIISLMSSHYFVKRILSLNHAAQSIAAGDYDSIISLGGNDEISELAHSFNTMTDRIQKNVIKLNQEQELLEQRVGERTKELEQSNNQLKRLASTDSLTQLKNRAYIEKKLRNEMSRYKRSKSVFSLIMLDIDHFKKVNDNYGHEMGDLALIKVAATLGQNVRSTDYVGRYGGEEFMVICPETDLKGAMTLAEKLRKKLEENCCLEDGSIITGSFGAAAICQKDEIRNILTRVDNAMYQAKAEGRNCVVSQ